MVLTKKRVATVEALEQRFGTGQVTRAQIMTALEEKLIPAWPYWMTDDLTLKVGRGVWNLPTPDEFTVAEKGVKATKPSTYRAMRAAGLEPPVFKAPKPVKATPKPKMKAKESKSAPVEQMTVSTKPLKVKKSKPVDIIPTETSTETVSPTA